MMKLFLSVLVAGASLVSSLPPPPNINLSSVSCINDDLSRLLNGNRAEAYHFCRSFLNLKSSTSIVSTVTPSPLTTTIVQTITTTLVNTLTTSDTATKTLTLTDTKYVLTQTITTTVTHLPQTSTFPPLKRNAGAPLSTLTALHPAASLSSACNCLTIPSCHHLSNTALPASTSTTHTSTTLTLSTTTTLTTTISTTTTVIWTSNDATWTETYARPTQTLFHLRTYDTTQTEWNPRSQPGRIRNLAARKGFDRCFGTCDEWDARFESGAEYLVSELTRPEDEMVFRLEGDGGLSYLTVEGNGTRLYANYMSRMLPSEGFFSHWPGFQTEEAMEARNGVGYLWEVGGNGMLRVWARGKEMVTEWGMTYGIRQEMVPMLCWYDGEESKAFLTFNNGDPAMFYILTVCVGVELVPVYVDGEDVGF